MTLVSQPRTSRSHDGDPHWREVEPGFWVANRAGEFLGTIEAHGARFFARDARRAYVGEYADLDVAQAAVESASPREAI